MNLKDKAKELKKNIPALFFALKREDTPLLAKVFAFMTVGYALSPVDLIPDFVPVLGYLDDVIILPVLVVLTLKFIPEEIFVECQKEAEGLWENEKPKRWYYALPIVVICVMIIAMILNQMYF